MWVSIALLLFLITLPGTIELLALTIAALLPPLKYPQKLAHASVKLLFMIPAYNEEKGIGNTLNSLKACHGKADILVIADNCTDRTGTIARNSGVAVMERTANRGKDQALRDAFDKVWRDYDAYVILDADSVVEGNFIDTIQEAFDSGASAIQTRYLQLSDDTLSNRLMKVAMMAFNILRPLGRSHLGLSAGCYGNGFGLSRSTLLAVPWRVRSIVEDAAYHLELVKRGFQVQFLEKTSVYAEQPVGSASLLAQRSRWEGGRLHLLWSEGPRLLKELFRGNWRVLEPLMELMTLPLSYHCLLLFGLIALPIPLARNVGFLSLAVVAFHILSAIWRCGGQWRDLLALLVSPLYLIWKLLNIGYLSRPKEWIRTKRPGE